ncbi:MAG: hypothetical protein ACK4FR_09305 [Tabrizicola sp.]
MDKLVNRRENRRHAAENIPGKQYYNWDNGRQRSAGVNFGGHVGRIAVS